MAATSTRPSEPSNTSGPGSVQPGRLLNRNFLLLWQGQFVSQIGTQAFVVAMMFWTMEATHSASLMGVLMMLSMLPGVVLAPLGGTVADLYPRKWIIIISDIVSGIGVIGVTICFFYFSSQLQTLIAALFLISVLNGMVMAFFRPAILAAIPDLVPANKLSPANSMNQFSFQFSTVLGQSTGGVLYAMMGAPYLFLADGITFLFSALSESFIHIPYRTRNRSRNLAAASRILMGELREGLSYIWQWDGMRNFLFMVGLVHLFAMPFIVLMPFYVNLYLGKGSEWYGFLMASFSGGSVVGFVLAGMIPIRPRLRSSLLLISLSLTGLLFGVLGFVATPVLALVLVFFAGTLLGLFNIHVMTIYQTSSESRLRGRVMGLVMTMANAASPLGMVAGGIAADLTDKNVALIYAACGIFILLVVATIGAQRSVREFLAFSA